MVDIEKLAQVAMEIISYAGTAKSNYILAYEAKKAGNEEEHNDKIMLADQNFKKAHEVHLGLMSEEMKTQTPQICLLLAHAEDQLMSVETIKFLTKELSQFVSADK